MLSSAACVLYMDALWHVLFQSVHKRGDADLYIGNNSLVQVHELAFQESAAAELW